MFEGLSLEAILIGAVVLVAAIILIIIIVGGIKSAKNGNNELNDNKKEEALPVVEEVKEEVKPMKVVLAPGDSVVIGSEGRIPCGEYTLESSDGSETFNVRIGRYVKEYANGCTVVLTEKQKVTAINTTIIIK